MAATDPELLAAYATARDESAFTELVRRHLDLVYAAALRQVGGDAHLAHDVTQAVFTDLSRKAAALSDRTSLAGWLYTGTHFAASKFVRAERTRRQHEEESIAMQEPASDARTAEDWRQLQPVIDAAMLELEECDREAVLLRFFTGRSFAEIGAVLRLTEDTARKRVSRALDLLHGALTRRGIRSTSAALTLAITHHASAAAPAGLVASVSGAALAGGGAAPVVAAAVQFSLMNKLAMTAAGIAIALLGLNLTTSRWDVAAARVGLAAQQKMGEAAVAEVAILRKQAEVPKVTPVAATEIVVKPSEMTTDFGEPAKIRAHLDATYAVLFRQLKLEPERREALKDLLTDRRRTALFELHDFLIAESPAGDDLSPAERRELEAIVTRDVDTRIRALLGPAGFAHFQNYEETQPLRSSFTSFAARLESSPEPLTDLQIEQLTAATIAESNASGEGRNPWSDGVYHRARNILSPGQLQSLDRYRASLNALVRIQELNRAAVARGLIKPESATEKE